MLTVSNYHYIREHFNHKYPSIFGVTPEQFKKQLRLFKNEASFIEINDLFNHTEEILLSKENHYLITFDDGLKEQYEFALPIMDELNVEGLFFVNTVNHEEKKVSTVHKIHLIRSIVEPKEILRQVSMNNGYVYTEEDKKKAHKTYKFDNHDSAEIKYFLNFLMHFEEKEKVIGQLFNTYFNEKEVASNLYMTQSQINEMAAKNYIGNHTHNHLPLGLFDEEVIEYELAHSKKVLEEMTKVKIQSVSYPYGTPSASTDEVQKIAKETGHSIGFTAIKGINRSADELFALNRFDCNDLIGGKNYAN